MVREHVYFVCKPDAHNDSSSYGCPYCEGGLGLCTVCGGLEGSLTTECCGVRLRSSTLNVDVYLRGLDFKDGRWHYPEEKPDAERKLPGLYSVNLQMCFP